MSKEQESQPQVDENELIRQRREKLDAWRESHQAYPNTFSQTIWRVKSFLAIAN